MQSSAPPLNDAHLPFTLKGLVRHSSAVLGAVEHARHASQTPWDTIGGVIRNGQHSYLASGALLEVMSLRTGARVASYNFDSFFNAGPVNITCVDEVHIAEVNTCVLAVGVQGDRPSGVVCLFAVQGTKILRVIEVPHRITSCCFVGGAAMCARSDLQLFDGCLAVGTEVGKVLLFGLQLKRCREVLLGTRKMPQAESTVCLSSESWEVVKRKHKRAVADGLNFGIQLKFLENSGAVLSMLSLQPLLALAVGLSDGLLIHYSFNGLEGFHISQPPEPDSPIVKMAFIEPANDPRACLYIWTFHRTASRHAVAVMHSITYRNKVKAAQAQSGAKPDHIYDEFVSSTPRLTMPICDASETLPIACQAISKQIADDDDALSLCVLSWRIVGCDVAASSTQVCVFDLNQWYKEQMPEACDWRQANSFLAVFPLLGLQALDVWMDAATVTPFSSIQRPEEHFWPASLNFECIALTIAEQCRLHWSGLQNQALEILCQSGPQVFLEPHPCFAVMVRASLLPQFCDYNPRMQLSLNTIRDTILSIALENNCVTLLRDCGRDWSDGSHLGAQPRDGLSLSTLTDWMWNRAGVIKDNCNQMCVCLFDHSGTPIDQRTQKRLAQCARQLKTLADLMGSLLASFGRFIPSEVMTQLQSQRNSIRMAHEYQEVLQWLLNMGLLPEGAGTQSRSYGNFVAVPYPYRALRQYYEAQRVKFGNIDAQLLNNKRSCRIMYIDAFIERQCNPACLRSEWRKDAGNGLYPPPSLQAMLRTLLVPGVDVELKYTLFVYLFLDLSEALEDARYEDVVQRLIKFPAVFKLNPALIKTTQAFWNLDHGHFETAIEELISPMSQDRHLAHWQQEILIETLIVQNAPHLALRALRAPGPPIAPLLEIRTLLANNLVAEAFQLQRSKADASLLHEFFKTCHTQQKWHYVLDLSLNAAEEESLGTFLRTNDSTLTANLHFVYLLQRSKYIEAISYVDDLQHNRRRRKLDLDTPNTIVAAYKLTMTPATRTMSDVYYALRDNINAKLNQKAMAPNPLSTKLLQRKLDLIGGIYHRTVISAEQTTPAYWFGQPNKRCSLTPNNVPFLRNPQYDVQELAHKQHMQHNTGLSYASVYAGNNKRNLSESVLDAQDRHDREKDEGPKKRRRIDPNANQLPTLPAKPTHTVETTLPTPVVSTTERTPPKNKLHYTAVTPQSILKIPGSPARSIRMRSLSPISVYTDDRLIRFNLPESQADFRAATPVATSTIRLSPRAAFNFTVESDEVPNKISPTKLANDSEPEDYFSPETSHTVDEQPNEIEAEPEPVVTPPENVGAKHLLDYSQQESPLQRRTALLEGPKPRKRIHEDSEEGDVKHHQKSPPREPATSVRRSLRSRSKTPDVDIVLKSQSTPALTRKQPQTSTQRKPLSRVVLEANAMKIIESTASPLPSAGSSKAANGLNLSSATLNDTTLASNDSTAFGALLADTSEPSESFLDRWHAERRSGNVSTNSSANESTMFESPSALVDSDASFAVDNDLRTVTPLAKQSGREQSPQVVDAEEACIIEDNDDDEDDEVSQILEMPAADEEPQYLVETDWIPDAGRSSSRDSEIPSSNDNEDYMDYGEDNSDSSANDSDESFVPNRADPNYKLPKLPTPEVINISSSSSDEDDIADAQTSDESYDDADAQTSDESHDDADVFDLVAYEVESVDRVCDGVVVDGDEEQLIEAAVYASLEPVSVDLPNTEMECGRPLDTTECSWQGLETAEGSLVENLDEAQIMETTERSTVTELNHALMRETVEESVEMAEESQNLAVTVSEEVNLLDQGYLMEDIDVADSSLSEETKPETRVIDVETEEAQDKPQPSNLAQQSEQIVSPSTDNVAHQSPKVTDDVQDEAIAMSPQIIVASLTADQAPKSDYLVSSTLEESQSKNIVIAQQATLKPPIELSSQNLNSTPTTTTRRLRLTRSQSISLEENADATPAPITTTPRRSARAKSIQPMDLNTPSTPMSSRKTRGTSEPKQAQTPVRRLLQVFNAQQRATPDLEAATNTISSTPRRRNVRRTSQSSAFDDGESTVATPTRRSRNTTPNKPAAISGTPKRTGGRPPRTPQQQLSPNDENDDTASVASRASRMSSTSTVTTRSQSAAVHQAMDDYDDDDVSFKSAKSTRTTVAKRAAAAAAAAARSTVLPAIDEIREVDESHESGSSDNAATTYSDSRRLTRHQISVMERIKKATSVAQQSPQRHPAAPSRQTRAQSFVRGDDSDDDHHTDDARSNRSGRSSKAKAAQMKVSQQQTESSPTASSSPKADDDDITDADELAKKADGEKSRPARRTTRKASTTSSK